MSTPQSFQPQGQQVPSVPPKAPFKQQQSHAYAIPLPATDHGFYEGMTNCLGNMMGFIGSIPVLGCCCPNPYKEIQQGFVGLISRYGKYYRSVDPGLYEVNVLSESLKVVDIRIKIADIPRQMIMTKDNVNINIDSVLYWNIMDPYTAAFLVSDVEKALIERTQTTLRQTLGTRTLQDIIENRDTIAHEIQRTIEGPAMTLWGISIESILIKDLQFSAELQETLAAAAKQKRIAEARLIQCESELASAKVMREASNILNTDAALQLRYLDTLKAISQSGSTKIVFLPPAASTFSSGGAVTTKGKGGNPMAVVENAALVDLVANM